MRSATHKAPLKALTFHVPVEVAAKIDRQRGDLLSYGQWLQATLAQLEACRRDNYFLAARVSVLTSRSEGRLSAMERP